MERPTSRRRFGALNRCDRPPDPSSAQPRCSQVGSPAGEQEVRNVLSPSAGQQTLTQLSAHANCLHRGRPETAGARTGGAGGVHPGWMSKLERVTSASDALLFPGSICFSFRRKRPEEARKASEFRAGAVVVAASRRQQDLQPVVGQWRAAAPPAAQVGWPLAAPPQSKILLLLAAVEMRT